MIFQKKRINLGELTALQKYLRAAGLNTVCESARCPNIGECFCSGTATFLIAGRTCTRNCTFCAVEKGRPAPLDADEPGRIADAVRHLKLTYAVITSVTRDDLPDGGADHFYHTVTRLRELVPGTGIEILVPDFKGSTAAIDRVCAARPDVFAHNMETVPRLYPELRALASYRRSLDLLARAKQAGLTTKSGIMLGLGETESEVLAVMKDLRHSCCDLLTIGQYLAPTGSHYPVKEFIPPQTFEHLKNAALDFGFRHCQSGTYVRSSYKAHEYNDR